MQNQVHLDLEMLQTLMQKKASFMFLDTPADTNSHTYGILMKVFSSATARLGTTGTNGNYDQHMRCPCTITVMEVGA